MTFLLMKEIAEVLFSIVFTRSAGMDSFCRAESISEV
jgi:hypothetical protein